MRTTPNFIRRLCRALAVLALVACPARPEACAFNTIDTQRLDGPIPLTLALGTPVQPLQDGSASWDDVARRAAADWNTHLGLVQFTTAAQPGAVPRQGDGQSTVAFSDSVFGDNFGEDVLAITVYHTDVHHFLDESDVLVNRAYAFDAYAGPRQPAGADYVYDLHRVLLHEFGHVLGLDHPDDIGQSVEAMMNSIIGDLDHLTADDLAGAVEIYGDPSLRSLPLPFSRLLVENGRQKIYALRLKASGKGVLRVVDPYARQVTASAPTGPKPVAFTVSHQGEHLYLGIAGLGVIDQVDPDTLAVTQEFALGGQAGVNAAAIAVFNGAPETLLVSQVGNTQAALAHHATSLSADFAVYDHGVPRPTEYFDPDDSPATPVILDPANLAFSAFRDVFNGHGAGTAHRFTLGSGGIAPQTPGTMLNVGDETKGSSVQGNTLYGSDGVAYNLATGTVAGAFRDVVGGNIYALSTDSDLGQAYFASPQPGTQFMDGKPILRVESLTSFQTIGTIALPRYAGVYAIRRFGSNGLVIAVVAASGGELLFIRSNLLAPGSLTDAPPAVTLSAPTPATLDERAPGKAKVVVTRTGGDLFAPLEVRYDAAGTAQPGVDYRPLSGSVTIPAGQASAKIKVVATGAGFSGPARTVDIRLHIERAYRWGVPCAASVTLAGGE